MTWEEAVIELRNKPENHQAILDNYFEEDIYASARRFYESEEYKAVEHLIPPGVKNVLDIGAGRGISSYALAKSGLQVSALEPDPSNDIGAGAIRLIANHDQLPIQVVESFGENLPFSDESFDLIYVRQVLHHAQNLEKFCNEIFRVLKPGGMFIATREHVLSNEHDLDAFLNNHLLHQQYGGEHAYTLNHYLHCIRTSGLTITKVLHPYSSVINYAPVTSTEMKNNFLKKLSFLGNGLASRLINNPIVYSLLTSIKAKTDHTPGRLYSFVSIKPRIK